MGVIDIAGSVDFLGVWYVELEGFKMPYETNITVAEVTAKDADQAEQTALNSIYVYGKTARELGATVKKSWLLYELYPGQLLRWRSSVGGIKIS